MTKAGLVYVAAPYSDSNPSIVDQRMIDYCKADAYLLSQGYFTIAPLLKHYVKDHASLPDNWDYWKNYCKANLNHCESMIVIMLEGWNESEGVQAEIRLCYEYNIPIYYYDPINNKISE